MTRRMPNSIFFTKIGHAIHGTDFEGRLGTPAFPRLRAAVEGQRCYAVCDGRERWRAQHHGDAHRLFPDRTGAHPRTRPNTAVARRDPAPEYAPQYNAAAGDPVVLAPQLPGAARDRHHWRSPAVSRRSRSPKCSSLKLQQSDDGYIYPADGSSDVGALSGRRAVPAPLRCTGQSRQQQYYNNRGYAPQYASRSYGRPYPAGVVHIQIRHGGLGSHWVTGKERRSFVRPTLGFRLRLSRRPGCRCQRSRPERRSRNDRHDLVAATLSLTFGGHNRMNHGYDAAFAAAAPAAAVLVAHHGRTFWDIAVSRVVMRSRAEQRKQR